MAELRATPQSPGWAWLAEKLGATRRALDEALPLSPGSFLLQGVPEEVREWSYGNYPLRLQHPYAGRTASRMPSVQPGRGQALADTALLGVEMAPLVGPLTRVARTAAANVQATPPAGVIKLPGGNWLTGQVERQVKPLKTNLPWTDEQLQEMPQVVQAHEKDFALNRWLDSKLTKYIRNEMATEKDPLRLQADRWATVDQPKQLAEKDAQIAKAKADMERAQRERGVEPEMLTRSRDRILQLEKERDFIAARKGLHYVPPQTPELYRRQVNVSREERGFPSSAIASSEAGTRWEDLADRYLGQRSSAGDITKENYFLRAQDAERIYADNPWLFKVPPETQVNLINTGMNEQNTGFAHMADELRNALNPNSGLPEDLLITPENLEKMTVAQVAELVDKIDAHRAVQKIEADKLAAQKSIEVYKEYPETEEGLRWVEMKMLDMPEGWQLPEGYEIVYDPTHNSAGELIKEGYRLKSPKGKFVSYGDTPEEAIKEVFSKKDLEEALKYEGDIMQHCVGRYCPDVVSGESRIFSLRDNTGRPHTTIEIKPQRWFYGADKFPDPTGQYENFHKLINATHKEQWLGVRNYEQVAQQLAEQYGMPQPSIIKQIKGVNNKRPDEKYLPFVQDFVKSQPWSDVQDLENTGLYKVDPDSDLAKIMTQAGRPLPGFVNDAELTELTNEFMPGRFARGGAVRGYAAGGLVDYDPEAIERIIQDFEAAPPAYAEGGEVDLAEQMTVGTIPESMREPGKAEEMFRALVESGQGFLGLEPGRRGSEAYRTGQALSNLPVLALPAAAVKGTGKAAEALKEVGKKAAKEGGLKRFLEGSKIQEPMYHITPKDFDEFVPGGDNPLQSGPGIWMTPNKEYQPAAHSVRVIPGKPGYIYGNDSNMFTPGTNVMPLYTSIKNPLITTEKTWREDFAPFGSGSPWVFTKEEADKIQKAGYDGILYYGGNGELKEVVAFKPNQVKSALGNQGTYDPKSPVITKAQGGEVSMTAPARKPAYAAGGPVRYDPAHVQSVIDRFDEEFTA